MRAARRLLIGATTASVAFYAHRQASAADLYCAGSNRFGQLGLNQSTATSVPTLALRDVKDVVAATDHTIVLTEEGRVLGVGSGKSNVFGTGAVEHRSFAPVNLPSNIKFKSVSTSDTHTCAVDERGTVYLLGSVQGQPICEQGKPLDLQLTVTRAACGRSWTLLLDDRGRLFVRQLPTIDSFHLSECVWQEQAK